MSVAKDAIYNWIVLRKIPAHRAGRLWKFKLSEVDERIREGKAADPNGVHKSDRVMS